MTEAQPAKQFPMAKADLCVKCGLCLPHCPTYQETRNEADSPRGRIALMQGLSSGLVNWTPALEAHLDGCLGCRSCERVCPAKVPYGELIDAGRTLQAQARGNRRLTRRLGPWLVSRPRRHLARLLLRAYQASGLQLLLTALGLLRAPRIGRWLSLVPSAQHLAAPGTLTLPASGRSVQLFRGCVGDIADAETLQCLRALLERCGIRVEEPDTQTCCGALHQHAGEPDRACELGRRNLAAFSGDATIVYAASGCGATLKEYERVCAPGASAEGAAFAQRVQDPHRLLLELWPEAVPLRPLHARIAVHLPCTQRNVTSGGEAITALLRKIPGATIEPLDLQHNCCGAAGTYFLSEPAMADRLLEHKLDALAALRPDYLVSSNIGCTLHLAAGLRRRGLNVPVLHPLALLARQWPNDR